jgi:hypothetical protein
MHNCPDCGIEHEVPEPVMIEPDPAPAVEAAGEADIEIARVQGNTAIKLARIEAGTARAELESRVGELEAQLSGFKDALDRLAPPPAPEPAAVVVEPPAEPEPEMPPRGEKGSEPRKSPQRRGFFG